MPFELHEPEEICCHAEPHVKRIGHSVIKKDQAIHKNEPYAILWCSACGAWTVDDLSTPWHTPQSHDTLQAFIEVLKDDGWV